MEKELKHTSNIPLIRLGPILRILRIIGPESNELVIFLPIGGLASPGEDLAGGLLGYVFGEVGIGGEGPVGEIDVEVGVASFFVGEVGWVRMQGIGLGVGVG